MSRPPMSRTPAGRKDGGIKLLDINEQPLGYAQAKKRKRMQGNLSLCAHARAFAGTPNNMHKLWNYSIHSCLIILHQPQLLSAFLFVNPGRLGCGASPVGCYQCFRGKFHIFLQGKVPHF